MTRPLSKAFGARAAVALGVCSIAVALALSAGPAAFGAIGAAKTAAPPRLVATVAGNPFQWPRDIPAPHVASNSQSAPEATSSFGGDGQGAGIVVFAGDTPFALIAGRANPLVPGDVFQGHTVKAITAAGIILDDGTLIPADSSGYAATSTQGAIPGATVPPITPQVYSPRVQPFTVTPQPAPQRTPSTEVAPYAVPYSTMQPFAPHPIATPGVPYSPLQSSLPHSTPPPLSGSH